MTCNENKGTTVPAEQKKLKLWTKPFVQKIRAGDAEVQANTGSDSVTGPSGS
jgi:hypothetical protein